LVSAAVTRLVDVPGLRDRVRVFRDRGHAGRLLSEILGDYRNSDALVMAIPAGGIPVAVAVGKCLNLPVDIAVVSKITFPWNTEAGYGALAFDGTLRLNDALLARTGLDEQQIAAGIEQTRHKVERRVACMRRGLPPLDVIGRSLIVVDDGLASGFTMRVAVEALEQGAASIAIAVPTGHADAVASFAAPVQAVYCANVRTGRSFAVADAYEHWSDIGEEEAARALRAYRPEQ
jgi:predicted phosphoribosyltransferase